MRNRPSARLLILDPDDRVLLFFFCFDEGPLAGETYWATPGGGVEPGENYSQAAVRELFEETGIKAPLLGEVAQRDVIFQGPDGEDIFADERYFLVRSDGRDIDKSRLEGLEAKVIKQHKWWSLAELSLSAEIIFPERLTEILRRYVRS